MKTNDELATQTGDVRQQTNPTAININCILGYPATFTTKAGLLARLCQAQSGLPWLPTSGYWATAMRFDASAYQADIDIIACVLIMMH